MRKPKREPPYEREMPQVLRTKKRPLKISVLWKTPFAPSLPITNFIVSIMMCWKRFAWAGEPLNALSERQELWCQRTFTPLQPLSRLEHRR